MSEDKNSQRKLHLNKDAAKKANADQPPPEAIDMGLNILGTLSAIAEHLNGIAVELSDIKDNYNLELKNKKGLDDNPILTDLYIEEREASNAEDDGEDEL